MRIGITGASGLIGSELSAQAVAKGHQVIPFSRTVRDGIRGFDPNAKVPADFSDLDALVHLAGEPMLGLWTRAKKQRIRESRINLSQRIVEAISHTQNGPRILVSVSGIGYYGDRGDEVLTESSSQGAGFVAELAGDWEQATAAFAEISPDHRLCHARLGVVLSQKGGALVPMTKAFRLGLGGRLGSGKQWVPWISLQDAASALLKTVETDELSGAINIVSPKSVTNAELTKTLAKMLHRPAIFPVPSWLLRLFLQDMSQLLLFSQRATPEKLISEGIPFQFPSLAKALTKEIAQNS